MTDRFSSSSRSSSLALLLAVAAVALALTPDRASGQRVGGSIGVSLTVLEPVATRSVQVTNARVGRDGVATVETTAPMSGPTSQLVMSRIVNASNGHAPVPRAHLVPADRGLAAQDGAHVLARITHRIGVADATRPAGTRDVQLRIEYLTVAGT